jgi:hypothetical protein
MYPKIVKGNPGKSANGKDGRRLGGAAWFCHAFWALCLIR